MNQAMLEPAIGSHPHAQSARPDSRESNVPPRGRSYHINLGKGLKGLKLRDHEVPRPAAGEVVVRVRATSINFRELMIMRLGFYPLPVKSDVVPLCDGAGEVSAVGAGVNRLQVGDQVVANVFPEWLDGRFGADKAAQLGGSLDGMLSEFVVMKEEALVRFPKHLSFEEAATLPCAGLTAWNALHGSTPLRPGDTVLTLGSGSVSLFAIQFASHAGARVIATTSDDTKAMRLKALGADTVINYRAVRDWPKAVREQTGGRGVDRVVEVGGAMTLGKSLRCAALGGEIALVGGVAQGSTLGPVIARQLLGRTRIDGNALFTAGATIRPIAIGSRAQFEQMNRVIEAKQLRPVIDEVFTFDQAPAAFARYATRGAFGKVVIQVGRGAAL